MAKTDVVRKGNLDITKERKRHKQDEEEDSFRAEALI
jgi:hypothetical protein